MGLLNKLGQAIGAHAVKESDPALPTSRQASNKSGAIAATGSRDPKMPELSRVSNALKEFLWNLDGLGRGTLLDLGPAWQTTLNFFIERGFRVTSDDLLKSWKDFLAEEEVRLQNAATSTETIDLTPAGRAARFVKSNIQYAPASFDAVLLWDILDYM